MVSQRLEAFILHPESGDFADHAREAWARELETNELARRSAERAGRAPGSLSGWWEVPLVPVALLRSPVASVPSELEGLRLAAFDAAFSAACLRASGSQPPMLSLVPTGAEGSWPSLWAERSIARHGGPGSLAAWSARGLDGMALRSWLSGRQREHRPAVLLATAQGLALALDRVERQALRFRLATGSALVLALEPGSHDLETAALGERLESWLSLPARALVRSYGALELGSVCYSRTLLGGDSELLVPPPWVRARVLDPATLAEAPQGEPGLLALFDLANLGVALHVLTEELARAEAGGFRLLRRAGPAELESSTRLAAELAA